MLIRGGGLLLERVGAFEKLLQGGADFDDQEEKMKRQGWRSAPLRVSSRTMTRNEYCLAANLASMDGVPVRKSVLA
jgi:hypothetical protein